MNNEVLYSEKVSLGFGSVLVGTGGLVDVIGAGMSAQTHQGLVCMEET